jgi:anaerobic magnesium-protoporphyrin IX monomethyl ester cyclase
VSESGEAISFTFQQPSRLKKRQIRDPRFLLLYSPLQFSPGELAKPDGSLSLAYLAGALRDAGYDVSILDCAVGDDTCDLQDTFYRSVALSSGLFRVGMSPESILKKVVEYDVIGVSSIFTAQTSMVLDLIRLIRENFPEKLLITGGVNARSLRTRFFASGVDIVALSEAEMTIVQIAAALHSGNTLTTIPGIAYLDQQGQEVINPAGPATANLDDLALPAWDLLPLQKYWQISRPHGGNFPVGKRIAYASLQTSRGCPFCCQYCHISKEGEGSMAGNIRRYRMKSIDRVMRELDTLKNLGAEYIYLEDDSLFAKKQRAYDLMKMVKETGLELLDVNGINLCHLLTRSNSGYDLDYEFIEVLSEANVNFLTLPFESASQRMIDKYASSKWHIDRLDTKQLFRTFESLGLKMSGNYMIGYPDETLEEIRNTLLMARRHIDEGMDYASLFTVVPFPGTELFDTVIRNGQLDPNFDPDHMRWTKSLLRGLAVDSETLEQMRQLGWLLINKTSYVSYKHKMHVNETI